MGRLFLSARELRLIGNHFPWGTSGPVHGGYDQFNSPIRSTISLGHEPEPFVPLTKGLAVPNRRFVACLRNLS